MKYRGGERADTLMVMLGDAGAPEQPTSVVRTPYALRNPLAACTAHFASTALPQDEVRELRRAIEELSAQVRHLTQQLSPPALTSATDRYAAAFASLLPTDPGIDRVAWSDSGGTLRIWTVLRGEHDDLRARVYDAEASFLAAHPGALVDFEIVELHSDEAAEGTIPATARHIRL